MKPFDVVRKLSDTELPQLTITGRVILDKDLEFRNSSNDGKRHNECVKPFYKVIKVGTTVDYFMMESRTAFHHELSVRGEDGTVWKLNKDTETFEGALPNTRRNYPDSNKYDLNL